MTDWIVLKGNKVTGLGYTPDQIDYEMACDIAKLMFGSDFIVAKRTLFK